MFWFPPDEGYQIRLQQDPGLNWVEVYVIRVAQRPNEDWISFNPLFVVRCYGAKLDGPQMGLWESVMEEMPSSVGRLRESVNATWRPVFGAIAWGDTVRLFDVNRETQLWATCEEWAGVLFLSLIKWQIQEFLDHVKGEFSVEWGEPYSYHWGQERETKCQPGTNLDSDTVTIMKEQSQSEKIFQSKQTETDTDDNKDNSTWDEEPNGDQDTDMTSDMASDE